MNNMNIKLINNHIEWTEETEEKITRYVVSVDEMINAFKKQNQAIQIKNIIKKDHMIVSGGCPNCGCYVAGKIGSKLYCQHCGQNLLLA